MPRKSYPLDYRQRLIELARTGRSPESLAKEFEPAAKTIRDWVNQAELAGLGVAGESDKDRVIAQLRRENSVLREEREILKNGPPAAGFCRPETPAQGAAAGVS